VRIPLRPSAKLKGLFDPTLRQTLVDWRFRDEAKRVDALTYTSTEDFVLPTSDPELQAKFARRAQRIVAEEVQRKAKN
jgi:hypothetical protein